MTTLHDKLARTAVEDSLLALTRDLDTVAAILVETSDTAKIVITTPGAEETVRVRVAKVPALERVVITFVLSEIDAYSPGDASRKPIKRESPDADRNFYSTVHAPDPQADDDPNSVGVKPKG
jgi:hypothetical protein